MLLAVAVLAALGLALAGGAPAGAATGFRSCAPVPFTPNSDDAAANIRVLQVSCRYARDFIRDSEGTPGARNRGFACTSRSVEPEGLAYSAYRCQRGARVIRWRRF